MDGGPLDAYAEIRRIVSDYIHASDFKRFISALDSSMSAQGLSTISLVSQFQGEGKSFLACAIAVSFVGFLGKRVLVVDATRSGDEVNFLSALVAGFNTDGLPDGALDIISGHGLAGGSAGQTDFRLRRGLERFSGTYDRIIIDTVSIQESEAATIDPIVVAKQSGKGLLVTSPLSLHVESVDAIARELIHHRVPLLGTVYFGGVGA